MLIKATELFLRAWDMLLYLPVPAAERFFDREIDEDDEASLLIFFPVVGAVIGLWVHLFCKILQLFFSDAGTGITGALIFVFGMEFLSRGRNQGALVVLVESALGRPRRGPVLDEMEEGDRLPESLFGLFTAVTLFFMRLLTAGILISAGYSSWIPVTLVFAYAAQACIATGTSPRTSQPLLASDRYSLLKTWSVAGAAAVVFGIAYIHIVFLAGVAIYFFAESAKSRAEKRFRGVSGAYAGAVCSAAETLTLVIGVLLLLR